MERSCDYCTENTAELPARVTWLRTPDMVRLHWLRERLVCWGSIFRYGWEHCTLSMPWGLAPNELDSLTDYTLCTYTPYEGCWRCMSISSVAVNHVCKWGGLACGPITERQPFPSIVSHWEDLSIFGIGMRLSVNGRPCSASALTTLHANTVTQHPPTGFSTS